MAQGPSPHSPASHGRGAEQHARCSIARAEGVRRTAPRSSPPHPGCARLHSRAGVPPRDPHCALGRRGPMPVPHGPRRATAGRAQGRPRRGSGAPPPRRRTPVREFPLQSRPRPRSGRRPWLLPPPPACCRRPGCGGRALPWSRRPMPWDAAGLIARSSARRPRAVPGRRAARRAGGASAPSRTGGRRGCPGRLGQRSPRRRPRSSTA